MKALFFVSLFFVAAQSQAKAGSEYTSINSKDCKTIYDSALDPEAPIDSYEGTCKGLGGYGIVLSGGDLRYDVKVVYKGKQMETAYNYAFHEPANTVLEWRFTTNSKGKKVYTALIYRLNFDGYNETTGESVSSEELVVFRLNGKNSCLLGKIPQQNKMNEAARTLADDSKAPCDTSFN